jgi:multidrug transporter EmrE-like cation transporter
MFNAKTVALFAMMIVCTVVANVLMKIGATSPSEKNWPLGFVSIQTLIGVLFFGAALLLYLWLLKHVPLNIAQAFAAVQFVGVILASWFVLGEAISPLRWLGVGLITFGVMLVAASLES